MFKSNFFINCFFTYHNRGSYDAVVRRIIELQDNQNRFTTELRQYVSTSIRNEENLMTSITRSQNLIETIAQRVVQLVQHQHQHQHQPLLQQAEQPQNLQLVGNDVEVAMELANDDDPNNNNMNNEDNTRIDNISDNDNVIGNNGNVINNNGNNGNIPNNNGIDPNNNNGNNPNNNNNGVDVANAAIVHEINAATVPDAAAHFAEPQIIPPPLGPPPRLLPTPNNTLVGHGMVLFQNSSLPRSFRHLVQQWSLQNLNLCIPVAARRNLSAARRQMFSKWLFLYNRVKEEAGYEPEREGRRSFPLGEARATIMNRLNMAADVMDQRRGDQVMNRFMNDLKRDYQQDGRVRTRNRGMCHLFAI